LFVGLSGAGKTLLINSIVNFQMGIKITDPYRYVLINEDTEALKPYETSEVTMYYIKAHNNRPPLIIIDTPGFANTRGIEFD